MTGECKNLKILRNKKARSRLVVLSVVYVSLLIIFSILAIIFSQTSLRPLCYVFLAFAILMILFLAYTLFLLFEYNGCKLVPATVKDYVLKFDRAPNLAFEDIERFECHNIYEKPFFKLIHSKIGKKNYGTLVVIKKDNSKLRLYFVDDVENVTQILNEQLENLNKLD